MVERKQITLVYQYNDNWIGGAYYILNIIKALLTLSDTLKPCINVVYNEASSLRTIKEVKYPYINFIYCDLHYNFIQKFSIKFLGKYIFKKKINYDEINNLYPIHPIINLHNVNSGLHWIPDFQERYLPHFFSKKEIKQRENLYSNIVNTKYPIVFSSENAKNDFEKFYPNHKNKKYVLKFVSVLDSSYKNLQIADLLKQYNVTKPYFIVPNQFWKHKNHQVILNAILLMKNENFSFQVVFTGKEKDYRNPEYVNDLKKFVLDNQIEDKVRFLGFIDRDHQLQLMKNSLSIIQPSLFEGWSTVVEDCKALNHFIVVSDIPLHREQVSNNCLFFDPIDADDLSGKMKYLLNKNLKIVKISYDELIIKFVKNFLSLME
ncbi:glycosyltransferase [Mucilaginibacter sp.]|uniref:glycosyltransferase n=1 Tax=Mucilaginibacter sp. TaxID=1882438 RepID=UPI003B0072AF